LNRAKESHQSTKRAPLSNSPAVSLFKTALSPTSCASAADILCYADCTLCSLDKAQHALSNIISSALLLFANCNLPPTRVCRLHHRLIGPCFSTSRILANRLLLQRCPHLSASAHSNFSCLQPQPSGTNSPTYGQHPGCSASQQHAECFPKKQLS
jgi:hypothetical protein